MMLVVTGFYACTKKMHSGSRPDNPVNELKTFLALGDSYTIGESVEMQDRFPAQTVALLRQAGLKVADPVYIARTGWTTTNLQQAILAQILLPLMISLPCLLVLMTSTSEWIQEDTQCDSRNCFKKP